MARTAAVTANPPIVFALVNAAAMTDDGLPVTVRAGQCWLASDPFCLKHPDLFGDYPPSPFPFTTVTPALVERDHVCTG